jgi:uncharacterized membrane protein HdeD (DUF308 family)
MIDRLARHWWALALRGVAALVFGLIALAWPGITLGALIIVFGAYALVDGAFNAVAAVRATRADGSGPALLAESVLSIVAGVIALVWPGLTALALLYLIAAWAIVTGMLELAAAIRLRQELQDEWFLAFGGIASVIFGVLAALFPGEGAVALIWLIGIYAVGFGVLIVALSLRLRGLNDRDRIGGRRSGHATPLGSD